MSMKTVSHEFSRRAVFYEEHAIVQREAAARLCHFVQRNTHSDTLAELPIPFLEVGCGTGLLSEKLVEMFPDTAITFIDVSQAMLDLCAFKLRARTGASSFDQKYQFKLQDAEQEIQSTYGTIFSSFTLQWVQDLENTIANLVNTLNRQGAMFLSVPCNDSFPEWTYFAKRAGVACTANQLPRLDTLLELCDRLALNMEHEHYTITSRHPSSLSFFRSLKSSGAALCLTGKALSVPELKALMHEWDKSEQGVCATYSILNAKLTRKGE
jgi:malonyl-CoA O-methyltransferase